MKPVVIVIGAGISGLSAAKYLLEGGCKVILIEKQDRIGGRIYSRIQHIKTGEVRDLIGNENLIGQTDWRIMEVGAGWIHSAGEHPMTGSPNPVKQFADSWEIATVKESSTAQAILDFNNQELSFLKELWLKFRMWWTGAAGAFKTSDIGNYVESSQATKASYSQALKAMVKDCNPDINTCSEADFASSTVFVNKIWQLYLGGRETELASALPTIDAFNGDDYFVTGGYSRIPQYLLSLLEEYKDDFQFKKECAVTKISRYYQNPEITTSTGEIISCDGVVLAVPAALIQQATNENNYNKPFELSPPLAPKKVELINNVSVGNMLKVHLHYEKSFWPENCQYILPLKLYRERGENRIWFSIVVPPLEKDEYTVIVCFYGADINNLDKGDADIVNQAEGILKELFGAAYIKPLSSHVGHRWHEDPNASGAWCAVDNITKDQIEELGKPQGKLFFAGDLKACDTTHASYLSGEAAAGEVLNALNQKNSTYKAQSSLSIFNNLEIKTTSSENEDELELELEDSRKFNSFR